MPVPAAPETITVLTDEESEEGSENGDDPDDGPIMQVRYSSTEVLRSLDFAACTDDELDQLHELMGQMGFRAHTRPTHRMIATKRPTSQPDLRRTIRKAMATGGEPIRRLHKTRDHRPRRLILLVDVSGSMESYARALLRFAHAAVVGRTRVEAFTIGTPSHESDEGAREQGPRCRTRRSGRIGAGLEWRNAPRGNAA